jgi:hypothetical protein
MDIRTESAVKKVNDAVSVLNKSIADVVEQGIKFDIEVEKRLRIDSRYSEPFLIVQLSIVQIL